MTRRDGGGSRAVSFDGQAVDFDRRAGLPAEVGPRIAEALAALAPEGDGVVVDLGAGTGQVGMHLVARHRVARDPARRQLAGSRCHYLGIDVSAGMLAVFRRQLAARSWPAAAPAASLVRADAGSTWPLAAGRAKLVFVSRAAHLLPAAVLVEETLRVASPRGALFVLGGVESEPGSLRAVLRAEMRRLLAEHGVEARRAGAARHALAAALEARGGEVLPPVTAASWPTVHRAGAAIAAWRAKPGLGGHAVSPAVQEAVLGRLEAWVRERYGGLEAEEEATERYRLAAVRLPRRPSTKGGDDA